MKLSDIIQEDRIPLTVEKKFGRVLFGDWQFKNGIRSEYEKDSEYEEEVFRQLGYWFRGDGSYWRVQEKIIELSKLQKYYPTLLKPDSSSRFPKLYRGLTVFNTVAENQLGDYFRHFQNDKRRYTMGKSEVKTRDEITKKLNKSRGVTRQNFNIERSVKKFNYQSRHFAESWTLSLQSAIDISKNHFHRHPNVTVIMEAEVPDEERLLKIRFTNTMYKHQKQYEVIRISNNPIKVNLIKIFDDGVTKI